MGMKLESTACLDVRAERRSPSRQERRRCPTRSTRVTIPLRTRSSSISWLLRADSAATSRERVRKSLSGPGRRTGRDFAEFVKPHLAQAKPNTFPILLGDVLISADERVSGAIRRESRHPLEVVADHRLTLLWILGLGPQGALTFAQTSSAGLTRPSRCAWIRTTNKQDGGPRKQDGGLQR